MWWGSALGGNVGTLACSARDPGTAHLCFVIDDPLMPAEDRKAIGEALRNAYPVGQRLRFLEYADADHGLCAKPAFLYIPRLQPRDGTCCLVTDDPLI